MNSIATLSTLYDVRDIFAASALADGDFAPQKMLLAEILSSAAFEIVAGQGNQVALQYLRHQKAKEIVDILSMVYENPGWEIGHSFNLTDPALCAAIILAHAAGKGKARTLIQKDAVHADIYRETVHMIDDVTTMINMAAQNKKKGAALFQTAHPEIRMLFSLEGILTARRFIAENDNKHINLRNMERHLSKLHIFRPILTPWHPRVNGSVDAGLAGVFWTESFKVGDILHALNPRRAGPVTVLAEHKPRRRVITGPWGSPSPK